MESLYSNASTQVNVLEDCWMHVPKHKQTDDIGSAFHGWFMWESSVGASEGSD